MISGRENRFGGLTMSDTTSRPAWTTLLPALALYLVLVPIGIGLQRERINPDGVCYIRLARCLSEGRVLDSVSGHWSPLISWCAAAPIGAGMDGQLAMRLVLAAWGLVFVAGAGLLLRRFTTLPRAWAVACLLGAVPVALDWSLQVITPDIIVAACLMFYFRASVHPRLLERRPAQLACGFWGGMAFLAKAYALPFVLAGLPIALLLRYWTARRGAGATAPADGGSPRPSLRRLVLAWATCLIMFAVVAGPWIALLSWKLGRFTFSTAGTASHAYAGPTLRTGPGLLAPRPGELTIWEHPEEVPVPDWSPFAGSTLAMHQLRVIGRNLQTVRTYIADFDAAGISLFVLLATPALVFLFRRRRDDLFRVLWVASVFVIYCGGYLLMHLQERYIAPVLWPVACLWCFHLGWRLVEHVGPMLRDRGRSERGWRVVIALILVASFGGMAAGRAAGLALYRPLRNFRNIAREIEQAGCRGPVAGTRPDETLYLAYHMNQPWLGAPASARLAECAAELERFGARTFIVWDSSPLAATFDNAPGWVRVVDVDASRAGSKGAFHAYRRP